MAGTLSAPPTPAEVAGEFYAREQQVAPGERATRQRDFGWAATLERQQALAERAPAVGAAWQLTRGLKLPAVPLHPTTLEPVAEAITDPLAALDHWEAFWGHGVGIRLGAHRDGAVALVGLRAASWSAWRGWVQDHAVVESVRPWSDEDPRRGELTRDLRPLGGPLIVRWQAPAGPPMRAFSSRGDRQLAEGAEWLRKMTIGEDRGGYLIWTAPAVQERLPVLKHRELAAGLSVLSSDDAVPLWAASSDRWQLAQDGSVRQPNPVTDCPAWLLERFGAKWAAA